MGPIYISDNLIFTFNSHTSSYNILFESLCNLCAEVDFWIFDNINWLFFYVYYSCVVFLKIQQVVQKKVFP